MKDRNAPWVRIRPGQERILDAAMQHIRSIPYKPSLRWVFYRLYQDGFYEGKTRTHYERCKALLIRARKSFYKEWHPDTLVDETREAIPRRGKFESEDDFNSRMPGILAQIPAHYSLDHFYDQEKYVEIWFEARAMVQQFQHFTTRVDLVPMGGFPSVSLKWQLAKELEEKGERYRKPIIVLYFGDLDLSGHQIKDSTEEDVSRWCRAEFQIIRCGLTIEQIEKYDLPMSIEGKGYQWEALSHEAAGEIITTSLSHYLDLDLIDEYEAKSKEISGRWAREIRRVLR